MPTLIDKLAKLGFDSQQTLQERKVIVVKENGKDVDMDNYSAIAILKK